MKQSKNLSSLSNHHQSEINRFKIWMIQKRYSKNTIKTYIHMIELFYIKNHEIAFDISKIERPIKARSLPKVITKEDIQFMLEGMHNLKHKTALSMLYGLGLRRNELLRLRIRDIDSKRMLIYILNAKGNRDRSLPLSSTLLELCRRYYRQYKPKHWFIEGYTAGQPYTASSLQKIFKRSFSLIQKNHTFTLHCLRHFMLLTYQNRGRI